MASRNPLDIAAGLALSGLGQLARGTVELGAAAGGALATGAMAGARALVSGEGGFFDESVTVRTLAPACGGPEDLRPLPP